MDALEERAGKAAKILSMQRKVLHGADKLIGEDTNRSQHNETDVQIVAIEGQVARHEAKERERERIINEKRE